MTDKGDPALGDKGQEILNPIVAERDANDNVRNGLAFTVVDEIVTDNDRRRVLIQSTGSIHNLHPGSTVNISYKADESGTTYSSSGTFYDILDVPVKGIGDRNGEMQQYFFTVDSDDVPEWFDESGELMDGIVGRVGQKRPDMPWTEDELDPELIELVRNYGKENRLKLLELFARYPEKDTMD